MSPSEPRDEVTLNVELRDELRRVLDDHRSSEDVARGLNDLRGEMVELKQEFRRVGDNLDRLAWLGEGLKRWTLPILVALAGGEPALSWLWQRVVSAP